MTNKSPHKAEIYLSEFFHLAIRIDLIVLLSRVEMQIILARAGKERLRLVLASFGIADSGIVRDIAASSFADIVLIIHIKY